MAVATITQEDRRAPAAGQTQEPDDLIAARERAADTFPGWDTEPTPAQEVLESLLDLAVRHDTVCQWHEHYAYRYYGVQGFRPLPSGKFVDDAPMGDYRAVCVDLCARLASAAIRRIPAMTIWQKAAADFTDDLSSLKGGELRDLLFPIFEESGIPERFEVRPNYEVYEDVSAS